MKNFGMITIITNRIKIVAGKMKNSHDMKYFTVLIFALFASVAMMGQGYEIKVKPQGCSHEQLFLVQHFRDELIVLDSAKRDKSGTFTFRGKKALEKGIYAFTTSEKKKGLTDFVVDDSQRFTIECDSTFKPASMKIKGSLANTHMFEYIARNDKARAQARQYEKDKKSSDAKVKAQATADMEALSTEMMAYEKDMMEKHSKERFFKLQKMFSGPDVPEEVLDKACYYRTHYWDGVDLRDRSLRYTPDLFNKMNYYFFGVLYYSEADTICHYADRMLKQVESDTAMLRYVLEFIMPKYYRSTKNIGWDQVWCYLVRNYYLAGKCTFATAADIANKKQTCEFLEKSLIGAFGQELFMADTNQSENPTDWISSHRFPEKYVILWFWDPDCHHCQEQTATLITLYDSLSAAGNKPFEVYAIGYESDVPKWKKYVKQHNLPFVNVGGPNVNIDYQEAYNIHGAPTMIILNADRQIIMNKTLPTASILPFLKEYEKKHPEQANRPPSKWQLYGKSRR